MKVLLLTNKVPYPANDGSSIAMASMVDGFLKNGADVTLLSLNTRKHFKSNEAIQEKLPAKLEFLKVEADTNINALGAALNLCSGAAYHVSRFYKAVFARQLTNILQTQKFDIIQLEGLAMAVYLNLIKARCNTPVTLRSHNIEYRIWERHIENEPDFFSRTYLKLQVKRLRKFETEAFSKADALVAITAEDERVIRTMNPDVKTISIPCGIDLDSTSPCENTSFQSDLAYLASFDWMPNVQGVEWFLEKVWPILKNARPDITFRLGGRHMPTALKNLNKPGVKVFSDVPEMKEFVCQGRILVVPLLAGSGMRIKIIENMALGKCQISTSIGAEGVMVKNGHDILLGTDEKEFASQVLKALDSEEIRSVIEKNARHTINSYYDNHILGKQLLTFYQDQLC